MSDEWPKPWDEITPDQDTDEKVPVWSTMTSWVELGPLRLYDGTAYINAKGGVETEENPDQWLPLDRYLDRDT